MTDGSVINPRKAPANEPISVAEIIRKDFSFRIAERFQRAYLNAVLLDGSRHCRERDERGDNEEEYRKYFCDRVNLFGIRFVACKRDRVLTVGDIPLRLLYVRNFRFRIGDLLPSFIKLRFCISAGFFVFRLAVGDLLFVFGYFFERVIKLCALFADGDLRRIEFGGFSVYLFTRFVKLGFPGGKLTFGRLNLIFRFLKLCKLLGGGHSLPDG